MAIYDDIAVDYAAVRANPFKRHLDVEEATFLRAVGDVAGKGVLDLACGTGHYARLLKARGAENVHSIQADRSPNTVMNKGFSYVPNKGGWCGGRARRSGL